jgi:hypothetical protein
MIAAPWDSRAFGTYGNMSDSTRTSTPAEEAVLASGARIVLPMRCLDWAGISASFVAPAARVSMLLPSKALKPLMIWPGKAIVTIGAIEYRRMADVEPYNEFVISVPVQYEPGLNIPGMPLVFHPLLAARRYKQAGVYVHRLPVTSRESRDAGVEIWGYPKTVAEISFEETSRSRRALLRSEGTDQVTLEVAKVPTRSRRVDFHTYSVKDGHLLRSLVQTAGEYGVSFALGGASCALGEGAFADELRQLGMGESAFGRIYSPRLQSLVHRGEKISSLTASRS